MTFNSIEFSIFIPIVFGLYWFVAFQKLQLQNSILLAASYVFYGWWDWSLLSLIIASSVCSFGLAIAVESATDPRWRKVFALSSVVISLTFLAYFKYFNFFIHSCNLSLRLLGHPIDIPQLQIILPVGISFYTFQTLSYTIDVWRREIPAERSLVSFLAYVAFFPQLVAGPIERASSLLPQFGRQRVFQYSAAVDGLRQILCGLAKKVLVADVCADLAYKGFNSVDSMYGSELCIAVFAFSIQIYADFSAYSDIAIGSARLFGFELTRNFAFPYFSRDIAEFWRRWHISLTTWFRDYVYVPLGGSRQGTIRTLRNVFIIFLLSRLWHGANFTFILWGMVHAALFMPMIIWGRNRRHLDQVAAGRPIPTVREFRQMIITFALVTFAWIPFRARNMTEVLQICKTMTSFSLLEMPREVPSAAFVAIACLVGIEWCQRTKSHALFFDNLRLPLALRWAFYYSLVFLILQFNSNQLQFIYFQF